MGGPEAEGGPDHERDVHEVTFSAGFFVHAYEVTAATAQQQDDELAEVQLPAICRRRDGELPAANSNILRGWLARPANCVSWANARQVCAGLGMRLPSEAEWEYAATGPEHLLYPWGGP